MPASQNRSLDDEYQDTYAFLCTLERFGILLGLENMTHLLDALDNPQFSFPAVRIAGSKVYRWMSPGGSAPSCLLMD